MWGVAMKFGSPLRATLQGDINKKFKRTGMAIQTKIHYQIGLPFNFVTPEL